MKSLSTNGFRVFLWRTFGLQAVLIWCVALPAFAANLAAGPMAGHRDARSVILWLQADTKASVQIEYWPASGAAVSAHRARSAPVALAAQNDFAGQIEIANLAPGTTYHYRVLLDGKGAALPHHRQASHRAADRKSVV